MLYGSEKIICPKYKYPMNGHKIIDMERNGKLHMIQRKSDEHKQF